MMTQMLKRRKSLRWLRLLATKRRNKELIPHPTGSICCEYADLVHTPTSGLVMPPKPGWAGHGIARLRSPDSSSTWKRLSPLNSAHGGQRVLSPGNGGRGLGTHFLQQEGHCQFLLGMIQQSCPVSRSNGAFGGIWEEEWCI